EIARKTCCRALGFPVVTPEHLPKGTGLMVRVRSVGSAAAQVAATLFASALILWGCGESGNDAMPVAQTSTFERIQTQVFDVSCSSDSCHSSVGQAGNMILDAEHSWDALINHTPANPIAASHGLMRVMPGQPDQSFLVAKLTDTLAAGEGLGMPYNA